MGGIIGRGSEIEGERVGPAHNSEGGGSSSKGVDRHAISEIKLPWTSFYCLKFGPGA
jgi:hypothetical protein